MAAYQKGKFPGYYTRIPLRNGTDGPIRSCETHDEATAKQIERLLDRLKSRREWSLLEACATNPPRVTLGELLDADRNNTLDTLRAKLADVDLGEQIAGWERWVRSNLGDTGTADIYRAQVATLVDDPNTAQLEHDKEFTRIRWGADLTTPRVSQWLASRTLKSGKPISTGTRRKYLYAVFSFITYLNQHGLLKGNPIDGITRPKKGKRRIRWETQENDILIVNATPERHRAAVAAVKSTGADLSPMLRTRKRNFELWTEDRGAYCGLVHIPGSKTEKRDIHDALIEAWARPYLEAHLKSLLPNAFAFDGITRHAAYEHHKAVCATDAVNVENYTLRDARHSWAVRARKRGESFEAIAAQLGNTVYQVATTYATFKPTLEERGAAAPAKPQPKKKGTGA